MKGVKLPQNIIMSLKVANPAKIANFTQPCKFKY